MKKKKHKDGYWKPVELRGNRPRGHVILSKKDIDNTRRATKRKIKEVLEEECYQNN